jgi:hypothetical protein
MTVLQCLVLTRCDLPGVLQVNVGLAWICAVATLILVPSDIYHAMQVIFIAACDAGQHVEPATALTLVVMRRASTWRS